MGRFCARLLKDESGSSAVEYALLMFIPVGIAIYVAVIPDNINSPLEIIHATLASATP